ncbi:hypothetical protein RUM4293_03530 [Ruegeria atlantica]|uniref:Uncharacterized protein n=1 Tax=Ruegeria atlantica TaxID=81569 RepID=A0A0P1E8J9_9RHOB|nr:hypothetical protein RUM4293_03530 [Ruegeria atlantica]
METGVQWKFYVETRRLRDIFVKGANFRLVVSVGSNS